MRVLVAGALGALGARVIPRLVARGNEVVGVTRSEARRESIERLGAMVAIADALDASAIKGAVAAAQPDAVLELLNALPKRGPVRYSDLDATNVLRDKGTKNLLEASLSSGVKRFVAESVIFSYGYGDLGDKRLSEDDPVQQHAPVAAAQAALDGMHSQERQVVEAGRGRAIEGIALRVGGYYGPGVGLTEFMGKMVKRRMLPLPGGGRGVIPWIHIDDAADAVVAALDRGRPGEIYNVVDDEPVEFGEFVREMARVLQAPRPVSVPLALARVATPYAALVATTKIKASNDKAKTELGWRPRYPTYRQGLAAALAPDAGR